MKSLTIYTKEMKKLLLFFGLLVAANIAFSQTTASNAAPKSSTDKPIIKNDRTTLLHAEPAGDKEFNRHIKNHIRRNWKEEKHDLKRRLHRQHRDRMPHNIPGR